MTPEVFRDAEIISGPGGGVCARVLTEFVGVTECISNSDLKIVLFDEYSFNKKHDEWPADNRMETNSIECDSRSKTKSR